MHNNIVENPYSKLDGCRYYTARKTAFYQRHCTSAVEGLKCHENKTAREGHCPVSIATVYYFDKAVDEISHEKGKKMLTELHNKIQPRFVFMVLYTVQDGIMQVVKHEIKKRKVIFTDAKKLYTDAYFKSAVRIRHRKNGQARF